jgi:hypothetical protein
VKGASALHCRNVELNERSLHRARQAAAVGAHALVQRRVAALGGDHEPFASGQRLGDRRFGVRKRFDFLSDHQLRFRRRLRPALRHPQWTHGDDVLHLAGKAQRFGPGIH